MASLKLLLLLIIMSVAQLAVSQILKANVSCLDCPSNYDLSENLIMVKCKKTKQVTMATTEPNGSFQADLPLNSLNSMVGGDCLAVLLGGTAHQLYASKKNTVSTVVKAVPPSDFFTISTPLSFSICTLQTHKCAAATIVGEFGDSKTFNLPLPPEWGLAPSSYYLPVLPIIGIP